MTSPYRQRRTVVLPLPLSPTSPIVRPARTSKETSAQPTTDLQVGHLLVAVSGPARVRQSGQPGPKSLVSCSTRKTVAGSAVGTGCRISPVSNPGATGAEGDTSAVMPWLPALAGSRA